MSRCRILLLCALVLAVRPAAAQHAFSEGGDYDPAVPTPRSVLGYELGERFTPHHLLTRYLERLAESSARVRLDTVAHSFEGREVLMAVVTSDANHARLERIRTDARRLADPRGASDAELAGITASLPAIAWLGYTVHGDEASGVEAAIATLYQLAAGRDPETAMILDSTVVLVDPVQNPDGHERHVQDVMRLRTAFGVPESPWAMIHQGRWPSARTSHYLFDLNRDWFILSHPETRGRVAVFREWAPHVAVDLHEMGSNSTYFFAPPMEPVNKNVDENIVEWWEIYAAANAEAFDRRGWSFFRREGYDEFYPGYGVSWPILNGAVGMTYEQASSEGGAIRREDGTVLTLREAASHHYAASMATLRITAARRADRVGDYLAFRRRAVEQGRSGSLRAVAFERDSQGRADSLVAGLQRQGIDVLRLGEAASARATEFGEQRAASHRLPAGTYVVDFAQPQGRLARAILEPEAELDASFLREELERRRTGQSSRFYDLTAWSLPLTHRLRAWALPAVPGSAAAVAPLTSARPAADLPTARYGYAWAPGSESGIRLLAGLLREGVRVWYAPNAFRSGAADFPHGAFLVRVEPNGPEVHERVRRLALESGAGAELAALSSARVDTGTDLGSNSVFPLRTPRVALVGGEPFSAYSFGFAWFAFDQRMRYPATLVDVSDLTGAALDELDVVVLPSARAEALERALAEPGREALGDWVRRGGTLVALDGATEWLAAEATGLSAFRLLPAPEPGEQGAAPPMEVPGAILRAEADTLSPLMAGIDRAEMPVLAFSDRVYQAPADVRPGQVVLRHAPEPRLRLSGYLWPEMPARLAESPYLWTERVGRGRIVAFAGDPNFRDLWRGTYPVFANAVLFGGSW